MGKFQRYQTEKAIIDALLKISEIIKKTSCMKHRSRMTTGNGDQRQQRKEYEYEEIYNVPVPPPMRALESYVTGFDQRYTTPSNSQRPSNCNRAPIVLWKSEPHNKRYYLKPDHRRISREYRDHDSARKRHRHEISSSSSSSGDYHRKRSSRHYVKHQSSGSNRRRRMKYDCQTPYDINEYSTSDC